MWNKFLTNNSAKYKCLRTIFQGIIGVIIANLDMLISSLNFGDYKPLIVALVMAILSPLMKALGDEYDSTDIDTEG